MDFSLVAFLLLLISHFPKSFSAQNEKYVNCAHTLDCGDLSALSYPFYDGSTRPEYCGHPGFKVNCHGHPTISISNHQYYLLDFFTNFEGTITITISWKDTWRGGCPDNLESINIDLSIFGNDSVDPSLFRNEANDNVTFFYDCPTNEELSSLSSFRVNCSFGGSALSAGYYLIQHPQNMWDNNTDYKLYPKKKDIDKLMETCKSNLIIPTLLPDQFYENPHLDTLIMAFKAGLVLNLDANNSACRLCRDSDGQCGYDPHNNIFACHCPDHDSHTNCTAAPSKDKGRSAVALGSAAGILAVALGLVFFLACILRLLHLVFCLGRKTINSQESLNVEAILKSYGSVALKRYTYSDIKKITTSFTEMVGQGGFGAVYKGTLVDGRVVAVKLLKQSKEDCNDFINEVASIGRTNHVNIITLLGFCFEGKERALVYEFMVNGSLEKFTRDGANHGQSLIWKTLLDISLGIARGLAYMHQGCQTRILHFDIKPHNILLDENFRPKISDFGLAKLYRQDRKSKISMSMARGTIGYMAPEVFCGNFGDISHKSDVYSYGMMILEVIGSRRRTNVQLGSSRSSLYFPNYIYKQLEHADEDEVADGLMSSEEKEVKRKLILVSLWCIQTMPSSRPSMSKVVQMLEASLETIETPPMPSPSSPPRPQVDLSGSFTTTS